MNSILIIRSSATGAASVSNRLVDRLVERLRATRPELRIVERDLDADPVPHLRADTVAAITRSAAEGDAAREARALSDTLIGELQAADAIIIGAPMYNFGIASTLKSWFDHVLRAGVTFRYGPNGPVGLVGAKPVAVIETRAGAYGEGVLIALDSQEPHLRTMLGFIGLADVDFLRVEGLASGAVPDGAAIDAAADRIAQALPFRQAA